MIAVIVIFTCLLAEISSSTASAAISVPIVMSLTQGLEINPIPYWYITVMAFNCAYMLPLTLRAIPVAYGVDAGYLIKYGAPLTLITWIVIIVLGAV